MNARYAALIHMLLVPIAYCQIAENLRPNDQESGIVTKQEIRLSQDWFESIVTGNQDRSSWVGQWVSSAVPFSFQYAGADSRSFLKNWKLEKGEQTNSDTAVARGLSWTDSSTGLRVGWEVKRFTDYPAVEWLLTFENQGKQDTPILENIQPLDLRLNHTGPGEYVVHGVAGGRSMPDDMTPYAIQLPAHDLWRRRTQLGGDFPSSNRYLPFFNLESPDGRGVLIGVGWSGNWLARIEVEDSQVQARAGLKTSHFVLHPGERVRTARILAMFWEGQRLHSNNEFRHLLLTHYVPKMNGKQQQPLVSVNVCFTYKGYGNFLHDASEKTVTPLVKPFHDLGAELLILDAGWYDGAPWNQWLGNWVYSKTKYPRGFRPISDELKADNMIFRLWFASENLSTHAPLLQEHPEWVRARAGGGDLRMDLPEAREWFLSRVDDFANREGFGCYRQDGSARFGEEPADRTGITESEHIAGLYSVWDEIKKRHPDMVMEGCSGGGRRIDLETVSRFHWHQKSDRWYDSESDQGSLCGANLYLPGGTINIPTMAVDDYGAWSSFGGQFSLGWDPLDPAFPMEKAKRQVELYKRVRPLLSGDYYPMTGCGLENTWIAYQFHRRDLNSGFALIFRRTSADRVSYPVDQSFKVRLRGLNPDANYRVVYESSKREQTIRGGALMKPTELAIGKAPAAELILYEPKK
jgi:alpha-galactosidase